jgi:hypothetical protein
MQHSFSGHETFPFRYGWLKKGVSHVSNNPDFFSTERAMVKLGVGKNMVSSIRHWCLGAALIQPQKQLETTRLGYAPTEMGDNLFLENGFDPFFEDAATLWLIHWQIASNIGHCTTWYWLFNEWHGVEFTKEQMFSEIQKWLERKNEKPASDKTLSRDIDVCVRTYVHSRQSKGAISEDTFDCPLTELNLITEVEDGKTYQFRRGDKQTLPNEVFLYALSEYWQKSGITGDTASLEHIVYDPLSPGKIFKLDEETVVRRLEEVTVLSDGAFRYDETAGSKQVMRKSEKISPFVWLKNYYQEQLSK